MKQFLKLIKYEFKRVIRNKAVMFMLLFFSVFMLIALSFSDVKTTKYSIGIYTDGQNIEDVGVIDLIYEEIKEADVVYFDNADKGIEKLKRGEICFFIALNSSNNPVTATFYYDSSSFVGRNIKSNLSEKKAEYTYQITNEFLSEFGITVNKAYFNSVTFKSATKSKVNVKKASFTIEVASFLSIMIMFGLAYSMSRDNENKISKNIAYMPINVHTYLWCKIIPYFLLGMLQMALVLIIGNVFFNIQYQLNPFIIFILSSLFILSTIMISILFGNCRSQIATVFLDMGAILIPIFASMLAFTKTLFLPLKIILLGLPITSFVTLLNGMMFSGIVIWKSVLILVFSSIIYYLATVLIIHKKTTSCKL